MIAQNRLKSILFEPPVCGSLQAANFVSLVAFTVNHFTSRSKHNLDYDIEVSITCGGLPHQRFMQSFDVTTTSLQNF